MIAALFVQPTGCYIGLPDVDPWPESRDARTYGGPYPVVAHPPCERWGRFWPGRPGGPRHERGADGGCFASALTSVRAFGGVLEHPADSSAFAAFGLARPPAEGWGSAGDGLGVVCRVEQGHYGHPARKATWLYARGVCPLPELTWGPSAAPRLVEKLSRRQRAATPPPFRDVLIVMARSVRP